MPGMLARTANKVLGIERLFRRVRHHRARLEAAVKERVSKDLALDWHARTMFERASSGPYGRIAIVSAMPPSDTGIANFSARFADENGDAVDVFTEYSTIEDCIEQQLLLPKIRIFPTALLAFVAMRSNYRSVVFSFGNSSHNDFVLKRLRSFSRLKLSCRISVEIHDPCVHNITWRFLGDRFRFAYESSYGTRLTNVALSDEKKMIDAGVFGIKALLSEFKVDEIVVHSNRAKEIVIEDYGLDPSPPIKLGFHPVFRTSVSESIVLSAQVRDSMLQPSIASFGIPGHEKFLMEKLEAFIRLRKEGRVARAIFAGYHAREILIELLGSIPPELTVMGDLTDRELLYVMNGIQLAVQLRRRSLGESSGIVPQLLGFGIPVICNRIGSFSEYGAAVRYLPDNVSGETIYKACVEAMDSQGISRDAMASYVDAHRSERLLSLIESPL